MSASRDRHNTPLSSGGEIIAMTSSGTRASHEKAAGVEKMWGVAFAPPPLTDICPETNHNPKPTHSYQKRDSKRKNAITF